MKKIKMYRNIKITINIVQKNVTEVIEVPQWCIVIGVPRGFKNWGGQNVSVSDRQLQILNKKNYINYLPHFFTQAVNDYSES